jgi:dihydroxyacetone kinase
MLDAMVPFADELARRVENGEPLAKAWAAAADLATTAAQGTADLLPRIGRARPHQEKSLGTPDPGAVSFALAVSAVGAALTARSSWSE